MRYPTEGNLALKEESTDIDTQDAQATFVQRAEGQRSASIVIDFPPTPFK